MENLKEIREKLAKLKQLKEGAGTEGEAMAAAVGISRILMKYNLSMTDIPDIDDINSQAFEKTEINFETTTPSVLDFRGSLLNVIAKAHFCRFIRYTAPRGQKISGLGCIVGQRDNVEVVLSLYNYLKEEIRHLTRNAWKVEKVWHTKAEEAKWKESFRIGCLKTLKERFEAIKRELDDTDTSHALVIQKEKKLDEAFAEFFPSKRQLATRGKMIDPAGFAGGAENAKSLKIQHEFNLERLALAK